MRVSSLAQISGPGKPSRQLAAMVKDLNLDLTPGTRPNRIKLNQTKSNWIKPDQTPPPSARLGNAGSPETRKAAGRTRKGSPMVPPYAATAGELSC